MVANPAKQLLGNDDVRRWYDNLHSSSRLLVFFVSVFVYNMWAIERNRDDIWCKRRVCGHLPLSIRHEL